MKIAITGDFIPESGLSEMLFEFEKLDYRGHFAKKDYGAEVFLGVCFRCLQPGLKRMARSKWYPAERFLGVDIVLPTEVFIKMDIPQRRAMLLEQLVLLVHKALKAKAPPGFDVERCMIDLKEWVAKAS